MKWFKHKELIEVGVDEAGRGCLAGPVVAGAVILNPEKRIKGLNDSKKLSEKKREELRLEIEEKALHWAVGEVDNSRIDEINILNASFEAMHKAIRQIDSRIDHILVDGNRFKAFKDIPFSCEIKGDGKFASIAAASILAKTHRDKIMNSLHEEYPEYLWAKNKGYPTAEHIEAFRRLGHSKFHRRSFHLKSAQLNLDL